MRAWSIVLSLLAVACSSEPRPRPSFDLDGDGLDELLVRQSWDGRVRRLSVEGELGTTVLETAFDETVVRVGDVNGDGRDDLAVRAPGERTEEVRVHLGRADGAADPTPFFVLETPDSLRNVKGAGDVDGDGLSDLIAVGFVSPSFVVYGDPSTPRVSEPLEFDGEVHTRIDLDGDGRMDLLSTDFDEEEDRDEHRVLLGGSDTLLEVPAAGPYVGSIPDPANPARDLMIGAVLVSGGVLPNGVARWTGTGFVEAGVSGPPGFPVGRGQIMGDESIDTLAIVLPDAGPCLARITHAELVLGELAAEHSDRCGNVWANVAGDLTGDGFDEVLAWVFGDDGSRGLRIHHGGHDALTLGARVLPFFEEVYQPIEHFALFAAGDLDGDGRADLLGQDADGCSLMVPGSSAPLRARGSCAWASLPALLLDPAFAVGDQDGRPGDEVLVPGYGLVSFGGGAVEILASPAGMPFQGTPIGDVDGDGFVDFRVGAALFAGGPSLLSDAPIELSFDGTVRAVWLGDVNGDGIDDVVVNEGLRFGGTDVASRPNDVELPTDLGGVLLVRRVGDRDGDGRADLAAVLSEPDEIVVLSLRDGSFVEVERLSGYAQFLADMDGDGRAEVLEHARLTLSASGSVVSVSALARAAGDVDGDGRSELVDQGPPMRWNGSSFEELVVEGLVPADEFVLAPVL